MESVARLLDDALAAGLGSAASVSVGDGGREVLRTWRGLDRRGGETIGEGASFDLASLTKPMATAALAMALATEGKLDLDAPIRRWFPDAASAGTVTSLLGHASGCAAHVEFWKRPGAGSAGREPLLAQCLHEPTVSGPVYSDLGYIILMELLARVAELPIAEAVATYVTEPLGLGARYGPVATLAIATEGVQGVVHDENARLGGGVCGHAGLFATIDDVSRFAAAMIALGAGARAGRIAPDVFAHFATTSAAPGFSYRLGFDTPSRTPGVSHAGERWPRDRAIGHLGFTGTSIWLDLARRRWVALLTNRIHPTREGTNEPIKALRRAVADAVVEALGA